MSSAFVAALLAAGAFGAEDATIDLKEQVAAALRETSREANAAPDEAVPRLVSLYRAVGDDTGLAPADRRRLQTQLRNRLVDFRTQLSRQLIREKKLTKRPETASAAGGATAARAAELIDLIRSTISPESWDVNGGRGSMYFYRPLNVLVVRQTAEVHHQLGDALTQLRR